MPKTSIGPSESAETLLNWVERLQRLPGMYLVDERCETAMSLLEGVALALGASGQLSWYAQWLLEGEESALAWTAIVVRKAGIDRERPGADVALRTWMLATLATFLADEARRCAADAPPDRALVRRWMLDVLHDISTREAAASWAAQRLRHGEGAMEDPVVEEALRKLAEVDSVASPVRYHHTNQDVFAWVRTLSDPDPDPAPPSETA